MNTGQKVLLADDDADFVGTSKPVLESSGYEVIVAHSGADCLEKARREKPDLIVLDMMMGGKPEGIRATYALRMSKHTETIPIVLISSIHDSPPWLDQPESFWLLIDAYIEKPVAGPKLLEWVNRVINKPSPEERPFAEAPFAEGAERQRLRGATRPVSRRLGVGVGVG